MMKLLQLLLRMHLSQVDLLKLRCECAFVLLFLVGRLRGQKQVNENVNKKVEQHVKMRRRWPSNEPAKQLSMSGKPAIVYRLRYSRFASDVFEALSQSPSSSSSQNAAFKLAVAIFSSHKVD
jgi:hypothetical protein